MKTKLAAALFALFAVTSAQANVITNGNFESGSTGWSSVGNVDLASQYGSGFYFGAGSVAQDGNYAVAFNSGNSLANGVLWQSFATTAGKTYTVSFDYGITSSFLLTQAITVGVYGALPLVALGGGVVTDTNPAGLLDTYTFDFVANSAISTLSFTDVITNFTLNLDGVLDNVSVNLKGGDAAVTPPAAAPVPEPGSLALLGLGVLGLGLARRRKAA